MRLTNLGKYIPENHHMDVDHEVAKFFDDYFHDLDIWGLHMVGMSEYHR